MIDRALGFIVGELNNYLDAGQGGADKAAVLASLSRPDDSVPQDIDNKLVLSLVNIERENAVGSTSFVTRTGAASYGRTNPGLYLNLYVLLTASYANNYPVALNRLGQAMAFFQAKWGFDAQNSAAFPAGMTQLSMEVVGMNMAELSALWAILGANYLPSVVYKLRMITIQEDWLITPIPAISTGTADLQGS